MSNQKHSHYKKDVSHLKVLDVYRIQELWQMHTCAEHVVKKMLVAGGRGHKDLDKDIQDCIDTLQRWQAMRLEDSNRIEVTALGDAEPRYVGGPQYQWGQIGDQIKWVARRIDGGAVGFREKPIWDGDRWCSVSVSGPLQSIPKMPMAGVDVFDTLEQRPS